MNNQSTTPMLHITHCRFATGDSCYDPEVDIPITWDEQCALLAMEIGFNVEEQHYLLVPGWDNYAKREQRRARVEKALHLIRTGGVRRV